MTPEEQNTLAEAEATHKAKTQEWQKYLREVESYHRSICAAAANDLRVAEKKRDAAIRLLNKRTEDARKKVEETNQWGRRLLGTHKGIRLFDDRVETPNGYAYFSQGQVTATIDSAGNIQTSRRPTLTRALAGGWIAGPLGVVGGLLATKKQTFDSRELYLLIEGPQLACLINCDPKTAVAARQFALSINTACKNAPSIDATRHTYVEAANKNVEKVKNECSAQIQAAKAELETYRNTVYADRIKNADDELQKAQAAFSSAISDIDAKLAKIKGSPDS